MTMATASTDHPHLEGDLTLFVGAEKALTRVRSNIISLASPVFRKLLSVQSEPGEHRSKEQKPKPDATSR